MQNSSFHVQVMICLVESHSFFSLDVDIHDFIISTFHKTQGHCTIMDTKTTNKIQMRGNEMQKGNEMKGKGKMFTENVK